MSVSQNFSTIDPSLRLNFQGARTLYPRITFERSSTGTYVDEDGLIKTAAVDQARFDYDPSTGESLGLLIEESRTNLVTYSEDFSQSVWIKQNGFSITSNTAIAPDGTLTADTASIVNLNAEYLYQNLGLPAGTYTLSCWIKSVNASSSFSISSYSGVDGSQSSSFTATNTWKRFSHTVTVSSPVTGFYPCIPSVSGEQFYIWGAQVEAGSFPTSYIPTSGSTVTRAVDEATITGTNFTDWYNPTEGSIFAKYSAGTNVSEVQFAITKTGSEISDVIAIGASSSGSISGVLPTLAVADDGVYQTGITIPINPVDGDTIKTAIAYKENDFAISSGIDTESGFASDSSGTIPTVDIARIGKYLYYGIWQNRPIARILYYPQRLSNSQLQNLIS